MGSDNGDKDKVMTQTILSCNIASISHANPEFDQLEAEDSVTLRTEPDNQFDSRAISVWHERAGKLGYVPKESTVCCHDALANKSAYRGVFAKITSFNDTGKWPKILLVVTIEI